MAELQRHQAPVNALAWAPHSSCHICSAGDDAQALIWDLSTMSHPMDHGLGAAHCPISSMRMPPCLHLLCASVTAANGCLWLQLRVCAVRLLHIVRAAASMCICLTQLAVSVAECTLGCLARYRGYSNSADGDVAVCVCRSHPGIQRRSRSESATVVQHSA